MKKLLSLILCLVLCLSLFACNTDIKKTPVSSDTKASTSDTSKEENKIFSPTISANDLTSLKVESDYLSKTFTTSISIDTIEKLLSYINGLTLKKVSTKPEGETAVTMIAAHKSSSGTVKTKVYFFESGKMVGISKTYYEEEEVIEWYDVCNENIVKPLDFLHTVYTPIKVVNGKLDFGDKKVTSFSFLYYQGTFATADHIDELSFKDTYNFEKIMTFFKNLEIEDPVTPEDTYGHDGIRYFRFYFENGSYFSIRFYDEKYLSIGGKLYPLNMSQREALYELLSVNLWNLY